LNERDFSGEAGLFFFASLRGDGAGLATAAAWVGLSARVESGLIVTVVLYNQRRTYHMSKKVISADA